MSIKDVRSAIVTEYVASTASAPVTTAYENIEIDPDITGVWAEFEFEVEEVYKNELGRYGSETAIGSFTITLHGPRGEGYNVALSTIELIAAKFVKGFMFAYNGQSVTIVTAEITPSSQDVNEFEIAFVANWRASVLR